MKKLVIASLALVLASAASAQDSGTYSRPDCTAFKDLPLPESKCFRKNRLAVRYENYEALQKTGLEFTYLARPPAGKDLEKAYPDAVKTSKDKVEGEFLINFSVNADGNVYDVKIVESTSTRIGYLARVWADTIAQWKFAKVAKPVTNVPFRRLYLYSQEDDDKSRKNGG